MIHPAHFRRVVHETLVAMGPRYASQAAEELLMLTWAHEGRAPGGHAALWQHRDGLPKGPAIGPFQMEPGRWKDTEVRASASLLEAIRDGYYGAGVGLRDGRAMAWDLRYATAMARAAYWLIPEPLPAADDAAGLASYWHRHWCRGCKGTPAQAERAYRRLVLGERVRAERGVGL
jgi:hypothetical protein